MRSHGNRRKIKKPGTRHWYYTRGALFSKDSIEGQANLIFILELDKVLRRVLYPRRTEMDSKKKKKRSQVTIDGSHGTTREPMLQKSSDKYVKPHVQIGP